MARDGGLDDDGDVEMTVAPPVFEFIKAPKLSKWSQASLVVFLRGRRQYEGKIWERCVATGEAHENVLVTIKSSIEPKILEHLAHYVFKTEVFALTEEALRAEIERKAGSLMNDHVPDVEKMFAERLTMDTSEKDVHARVANYFIAFDKLVEDNGLATWVGRGSVTDAAGQQRMKMRCKLLMANLAPAVLKVDIQRMASVTHRHVKQDDIALYELIVKRASLQQHYHQMQSDVKRSGSEKSKSASLETKNKGAGTKEQSQRSASKERTPSKPIGAAVPPTSGCLVCKGSHWVKDCPSASQEQKTAALQAARDRKKGKVERVRAVREATATGDPRRMCINGVLDVPFCPDTGADSNIISKTLVDELLGLGAAVELRKLSPPVKVQVAGGALMLCRSAVTLDLRIETAAGPLNLRSVPCLVLGGNEDEFLLGRKTMRDIGIDIDRLFEQLADGGRVNEADGDDVSDNDTELHFAVDMEEIHWHLDRMLDEAKEADFEPSLLKELRALVYEYADVWRVHIGADPPADVEPLVAQLRPDAQPYRSGTRKYPEPQRKFLRDFVRQLEKNGLVKRNNTSRWACPALPVKKPHSDEFRCTMDYRPANKWTVALAGATPNLVVVIQNVKGACAFGLFDLFKGFWQLPLHPSSQELYSFVTEDGVFTPTRVPQGASDSATHFQLQMQDCFRDMLYDNLLVWIDDLLLFAKTPVEYLAKLRQFFVILRARRLKLNATKCLLFSRQVTWCGKVVDGDGIRHSPERLEALVSLPLPPTAAALQQFLCAANWMRDSMVDYARTVHPLQMKLEDVMAQRGRRKSQLAGVDLTWTDEDKGAFKAVVDLLTTSNKQHFADKDARVCLLTDASNTGWSIVVSQVHCWDKERSVAEQAHELLVCRGGQFTGAQLNWSIIEKEAYPVVRACADLAYLLDREKGVHIYCDHANLVYIFAPNKTVKPHLRGKLQRWAMQMVGIRYEIEHISGDANVWADLVSRWGQRTLHPSESAVAVKRAGVLGDVSAGSNGDYAGGRFTRLDLSPAYMHVPMDSEIDAPLATRAKRVTTRSTVAVSPLRPLQDDRFIWPSEESIRDEQRRHRAAAPSAADENGCVRVDGKLWVPREARDLIQRLLVVAHCGPQGHRGSDVMVTALNDRFAINNTKTIVARFLRGCLLCKHVKGGKLIQRPWGPTTTATQRNECLHMDYLELGESYGTSHYVLVLKDELTHYCELVVADSATSATAAAAVLDWHKRFGLPKMWESDNGSHFKAALMQQLADRLKVVQKFVPVYTPWINGTVERVNRDILQVLRVMLMELNLDTRNWPHLLPLIQANLNHSAVASLRGHAPIELFTGLPAPSLLDTVVVPVGGVTRTLSVDMSAAATHLDQLRQHLAEMHTMVIERKEQRRTYALAKAKGQTCNFEVGDFVLWSRVDKRMRGSKLLVRWVGPFRVTQALSHSFIVAHLLTGDEFEVHGSRLKHYCDSDLGATAEIREHVASQGIVLGVRAIVDHRFEPTAQEWQLLVAWRGLEDLENSWEPFSSLNGDVPSLIAQYVESVDAPELAALL